MEHRCKDMPGEVDLRYNESEKKWIAYDDKDDTYWFPAKYCQDCGIDLNKMILQPGGSWGAKYN